MKNLFRLTALSFLLCLAAPVSAQSLLDRLQGLYYPAFAEIPWSCRQVGMDGGALAIQGMQVFGVENICDLRNPFVIPGMDAIKFDRTCTGEGTTYDAGPMIVMPSPGGVLLISEGFATEWTRCPR